MTHPLPTNSSRSFTSTGPASQRAAAILVLPLALAATWLIWGSTFLAMHVAVADLPPLLMMGARFVVAGLVVVALVALTRRHPMPTRRQWRDAAVVGGGLVTVGMGATSWASAAGLATGIEALLVASASLWMTFLARMVHGTRLALASVIGLAIGVCGITVLVVPGFLSGGDDATAVPALPAIVLLGSTFVWAAASLFAPRAARPASSVLATGMQMLVGGALLVGVALASGEGGELDIATLGMPAIGAWGYLVGFGSLGAFLAYGWLLENASPVLASTYAFVNPVIALALGAALLGEQLSTVTAIAVLLVLVAVTCILAGEARTPAAASATPSVRVGSAPRRPRSHGRSTGLDGWMPGLAPAAMAARRVNGARSTTLGDGMDAEAIDAAFDALHRHR